MKINEKKAFSSIGKRYIVIEFFTDLFPGEIQRYTVDKFVKINDTMCARCDFGDVRANRCAFFSFTHFPRVIDFLRQ